MSMFYELMMRKKTEIMYATIKGSLTENDGVFSGFSYNNYLATQDILDTSKDFEIVLKTNTGTMTNDFRTIFRNSFGSNSSSTGFVIGLAVSGGSKYCRTYMIDSSGTQFASGTFGTSVFTDNNDYFFKLSQKQNNGTYTIKLESSTDGITWTTENSWTNSLPIRSSGQGVAFGGGSLNNTNQFWSGSIDLNNSYIKLGSTKYELQAVVGYTKVGSPTISDGVVSGFSIANYLTYPVSNEIKSAYKDNFEIRTKIEVGTSSTEEQIIQFRYRGVLSGLTITNTKKIKWYVYGGTTIITGTTVFNSSDIIYIKAKIQNNVATLYTSTDNINWLVEGLVEIGSISPTDSSTTGYIGVASNLANSYSFTGKIYLNETIIKGYNKLYFNGQQA